MKREDLTADLQAVYTSTRQYCCAEYTPTYCTRTSQHTYSSNSSRVTVRCGTGYGFPVLPASRIFFTFLTPAHTTYSIFVRTHCCCCGYAFILVVDASYKHLPARVPIINSASYTNRPVKVLAGCGDILTDLLSIPVMYVAQH